MFVTFDEKSQVNTIQRWMQTEVYPVGIIWHMSGNLKGAQSQNLLKFKQQELPPNWEYNKKKIICAESLKGGIKNIA